MTRVIEKSGTGIGRSGTGIEKSGTGIGRLSVMLIAFTAMTLSGIALASDARLAVSSKHGHAIVSVHGEDGVMIGVSLDAIDEAGYARVPLFSVLQIRGDAFSMGLLVQGSGSGSAGQSDPGDGSSTLVQGSGSGNSTDSAEPGGQLMVQGSGSGSAGKGCSGRSTLMVQGSGSGTAGQGCSGAPTLMVQGSGSGSAGSCSGRSTLMVQGSGSGTAGQGCSDVPTLMVQGSGSGSAGEGCNGRSTLMVQGSGSGSARENATCAVQPWGFAEVVVDDNGTHVIISRLDRTGAAEEYLMAFLASGSSAVSSSFRGKEEREAHEFVAVP